MKLKGFSVHFRLDPIFMLMHKQIIWARKRDGSIGCAGVMMNCSNCNENEPRFYFFFIFLDKSHAFTYRSFIKNEYSLFAQTSM